MGWRKNTVDLIIVVSTVVAIYSLIIADAPKIAVIFLILALSVSIFRRTIYNALP